MRVQGILTAVVAISTVTDAAIIRGKFPFTRALQRRQFDNGFGGGGFGGGGFGDDGNFDDGNNDDQNQDDQNQDDQNQDQNQDDQNQDDGGDNGGGDGNTTLNPDVIQEGSQQDGNPNAQEGEAASETDDANFINFCEGQDLTNGEQKEGGSCNGIPMGNIPATDRMVAAVFTNPQNGDDLPADQDFTIDVQMLNFAPGTFTNADTTYYSAPQDLDGSGNIIGHTHVTVQDTGDDLNPTQPLDPQQFAFFKGINDAGNGQGLLSADVEGGLPAGNYRLCSMASAANHQPVIMPVAQRGAQDDCVRFTVGGGNGGDNSDNGDDQNQDDQNQDDQNQDDQNQDDQSDDGGQFGDGGGFAGNNTGQNFADEANQPTSDDSDDGTNDSSGGSSGGASSDTALGGIAAPEVQDTGDSDRPFEVNGDSFTSQEAAAQRACDAQRNACFDAVNFGQADGFSTGDCDAQLETCVADLSG